MVAADKIMRLSKGRTIRIYESGVPNGKVEFETFTLPMGGERKKYYQVNYRNDAWSGGRWATGEYEDKQLAENALRRALTAAKSFEPRISPYSVDTRAEVYRSETDSDVERFIKEADL